MSVVGDNLFIKKDRSRMSVVCVCEKVKLMGSPLAAETPNSGPLDLLNRLLGKF